MRRIRRECGDDFIIGLAINDEPEVEVRSKREALAEIVDLHDRDNLMDYVTCGSGSYFDFYKIMPTFIYPEKLGADLAGVLKATVRHALVTAESHIRTPENAESVLSEGRADMVSIVRGQIADPHLANKAATGEPRTFAAACPATRCAGAGARAITGSAASSTRPRAANWNGAATASRRRSGQRACWSSAADRPGSKRRASRQNAATA